MNTVRESSSRQASMADVLDGIEMSEFARARARGRLLRAEAMINGVETVVKAIGAGIAHIGELSAAWRLKTVPRTQT